MSALLDPAVLLTLLLALGAFAAVGALGVTLAQRDQTHARLRMVTERRRALAIEAVEALRPQRRALSVRRWSNIQAVVERLKLLQADTLAQLRRQMTTAGWRDPSTPALFIAAICILPIVLGALGLMWSTAPAFAGKSLLKVLLPLGFCAAGVMLPRLYLLNAITKRRTSLTRAFPDALDLIVICVEAGLSAEAGFNRVTDELMGAAPAMAEEFGLLAAELAFLPDRRRPLENLAERTGLPAIKSLSTTLLQSEKYGTPVALGLRVLAQENRETRMATAEKKAASLPAKLTVPMIVFFLPVLFAVITGPAAIQLVDNLR